MQEYPIYAGGQFVTTREVLPVKNPFDGNTIATTFLAGQEDLEFSIEKALAAKDQMRSMPSYKRYEALWYTSAEITNRRNELARILSLESGKPLKYSLAEIDRAAQVFLIAAEESKRLPGELLSIDWTRPGEGKEAFVKYFPVGLIAGISPFNFPMNLAVHKIAPALASGNCIILKPARSTPLSVLELAGILNQTDLPEGAVSILPMDREAGNQLVTDERFNMLSFTGSPEVGWKMKNQAGKKKVTLELGGNAGVIVTPSANLDLAVMKCLSGGFSYSGQVCIHVQRIYVHKSLFTEFAHKYIEAVTSLKYGNPLDPETDISVMIDLENAIRVESWVKEAIQAGARVLTGNVRKQNYVEPTVLTNTRKDMKVCANEVFGPVVILEAYEHFRDAIQVLNDSRYGLQAGVFTNQLHEFNRAVNDIEAGGIIVNDVPAFRVDHMPYGGIKDSGFGREGIKYAIAEMMEPKTIVRNIS
jgi:acyl-CoA reductase-like NAD-dependent aldehyde dehydrogenase